MGVSRFQLQYRMAESDGDQAPLWRFTETSPQRNTRPVLYIVAINGTRQILDLFQ